MRGDGTLYKRCDCGKSKWTKCDHSWWMKFSRDSKAFSMTCKTPLKSVASEQLRKEIEKARGAQWLEPAQRKVTIGELIDDLLKWYRINGRESTAQHAEWRYNAAMKATFATVRADQLTSAFLREHRAKRLSVGINNSTINREFALLRRAFKIALRCEPPKVARIPHFELTDESGNARKVFIPAEIEERLKAAAAKRGLWQRTWIEAAFTYGWRKSEFEERLFVRNVDIAGNRLRLDSTKNGEPREVALTPNLRVLFQALIAGQPGNARVFAHSLKVEWRDLCASIGVGSTRATGYTMHDIRRSSARNKRAAGVDTSIIMAMQGWKTQDMFRRYAIVDQTDVLSALDAEARLKQRLAEQRAAHQEVAHAN